MRVLESTDVRAVPTVGPTLPSQCSLWLRVNRTYILPLFLARSILGTVILFLAVPQVWHPYAGYHMVNCLDGSASIGVIQCCQCL